jgi:nucleoid-associated protein YgaU
MPSLLDMRDSAETIAGGVETAQARVAELLRTGRAAPADVRHLAAELRGQEEAVRVLRRQVDNTDVAAQLVHDRADLVLTTWRWERGLRRSLVALAGQLRAVVTSASALERGRDRRVVIARSGDTLQRIAQRALGDWREWPRLLDANPGLDPGTLTPGTEITIPAKR